MRKQPAFITLLTLTMLLCAIGCGEREDREEPPQAEPPRIEPPQTEPQAVTPPAAETRAGVPPVPEAPPIVEVDAGIPEAPAVTATYLGEVLVSWNMGKSDEAVQKFVALSWDDPAVFQGIPALAIGEEQLASLQEAQRNRVVQHAQELAGTLRDLVRAVAGAGDTLAVSGNTEGARAHFDALKQCGQALQSPNHVVMIQLVGEAMATFAQEKLDAIQ